MNERHNMTLNKHKDKTLTIKKKNNLDGDMFHVQNL